MNRTATILFNCGTHTVILSCLAILFFQTSLFSQIAVEHAVSGSGGSYIISPSKIIITTIGQPNAGMNSNATIKNHTGFMHLLAAKISASISGIIFFDKNGNEIHDSSESALSNWKVILGGNKNETTYTNESGQFTFRHLSEGNYSVTQVYPDGWLQTYPVFQHYTIPVSTGKKISDITFGNISFGTIAGSVYEDFNSNNIVDSNDVGIAERTVHLNGDNFHRETITDNSGSYSFLNVPAGEYVLSEILPSEWTQTFPLSPFTFSVTMFPQSIILNNNFFNFRNGIISGIVWKDNNNNGIRDTIDKGISEYTVLLRKDNTVVDSVSTNAEGKYLFTVTQSSAYHIQTAERSGWIQTSPIDSQNTLNLYSGNEFANIDLSVIELNSLSGKVFNDVNVNAICDSNESGIANWQLYLSSHTIVLDSIMTDESGKFLFANISSGTYFITQKKPSGWKKTLPMNENYTTQVTYGEYLTNFYFGNYRTNSLAIQKARDEDGNIETESDRTFIPWELSVSFNDTIIHSQQDSLLFIDNLSPGIYTIAQSESLYWKQLGVIVNGERLSDTVSKSISLYLSDGEYFSIIFIDRFAPDQTKYRTIAADTLLSQNAIKLKRKKGKPIPLATIGNIRDTLVRAQGGLSLGIVQAKNSPDAKKVAWIYWKTGKQMGKFYTSAHTGKSYGLDTLRIPGEKKRALKKAMKPSRKSYNNPLAEQMGAFRLNMEAANRGVFQSSPQGFDVQDLIFIEKENPFYGMTLHDIAHRVDSILTYWNIFKDSLTLHHPQYDAITAVLKKINKAFSSPIDGDDILDTSYSLLIIRGEIPIAEVPFLQRDVNKPAVNFAQVREQYFPDKFALHQNYPNPFNPATTIRFFLSEPQLVSLKIYNIIGQEIATLISNTWIEDEMNEVEFDATQFSSGVYFYRLSMQSEMNEQCSVVKKMLLVK